MRLFYAYIDEAGDEGFGKLRSAQSSGQSTWLMLGAIIVSADNDRELPTWRDEIVGGIVPKRRRELHFRNLKHNQRVFACRILSKKQAGICVVASDKRTIPDLDPPTLKAYKNKQHLYNYLTRLLLERLTDACCRRANGDKAHLHVTFSRRANTDYNVMRDYLHLMRDGREKIKPVRSINWNVLSPADVAVVNHSERAGLQLADLATSATFSAFEPNAYGDVEERYASILANRYIKRDGRRLGFGLTIVPRSSTSFLEKKKFLDTLEK